MRGARSERLGARMAQGGALGGGEEGEDEVAVVRKEAMDAHSQFTIAAMMLATMIATNTVRIRYPLTTSFVASLLGLSSFI